MLEYQYFASILFFQSVACLYNMILLAVSSSTRYLYGQSNSWISSHHVTGRSSWNVKTSSIVLRALVCVQAPARVLWRKLVIFYSILWHIF
jgi:hypothetical protein